jgi:hypothetical protein
MRLETRIKLIRLLIGGAVSLLLASAIHAQQPSVAPSADPIKDNSFLIEEAYNQDPGVVQHINTFARPTSGSAWAYTFTQEWPVRSMRHQLSYVVPLFDAGSGTAGGGVGDLAVNYRFQLAGAEGGHLAVAPRASILLPTGDATRGTGAGGASVQLMLPVSVTAGDRVAFHANAGLTYTARARNASGDGAAAASYTGGASIIWLTTSAFNVLVESVWNRTATVVARDIVARSDHFMLAPGIRWAYNLPRSVQIVPGIAYAVGIGPSRDRSIVAYLSVEHPFTR